MEIDVKTIAKSGALQADRKKRLLEKLSCLLETDIQRENMAEIKNTARESNGKGRSEG